MPRRPKMRCACLPSVFNQKCIMRCPLWGLLPSQEAPGHSLFPLILQSINEERPPTPPRGRPANQSSSMQFFD